MRRIDILSFVIIVLITWACQNENCRRHSNEKTTGKYFEAKQQHRDVAALTLFFAAMPKGGDLHNHYSGAVYAETYLEWADSLHYRLNAQTFTLDTSRLHPGKMSISFDSLQRNPGLYRAVIETWSDLDYSNHFQLQDPPDQHFFNTFNYFGPVSGVDYKKGLKELKNRAQKENVQYIETMLKSQIGRA